MAYYKVNYNKALVFFFNSCNTYKVVSLQIEVTSKSTLYYTIYSLNK